MDGHCPTGQCLLTDTAGDQQTEVTPYVASRKPTHKEGKGEVCFDSMLLAALLVENHCRFLRLFIGGVQSMTSAPPGGEAESTAFLGFFLGGV